MNSLFEAGLELQDWMDIEGIIIRQGNCLNRGHIFELLTPLCELKEALEIVDKLKHLMQEI